MHYHPFLREIEFNLMMADGLILKAYFIVDLTRRVRSSSCEMRLLLETMLFVGF